MPLAKNLGLCRLKLVVLLSKYRPIPLILAAILLLVIFAGCWKADNVRPASLYTASLSVEEVLNDNRVATENISSFRMSEILLTPIPGSSAITSITMIWQQPDLLITTVRGEGEPRFQQAFQRGDQCFARQSQTGIWEQSPMPCGASSNLPTLLVTDFLSLIQPAFVDDPPENSKDMHWIRGVARNVARNTQAPTDYQISNWELEISKSDGLIRRAFGYSAGQRSPLVIVEITDYDASFDEEISQIEQSIEKIQTR